MFQAVIKGKGKVLANINKRRLQVEAGMVGTIRKAQKPLMTRIRANINWQCHSLKWLADQGHPYGKKHLNNPHSPYYLVHRRSGAIRNALSSDIGADSREIRGGIGYTEAAEDSLTTSNAKASYIRAILKGSTIGTGGMVERDFLSGSMREVEKQIGKMLIDGARKTIFRKT